MVTSLIEQHAQQDGGMTADDEENIKSAAAVLYGGKFAINFC